MEFLVRWIITTIAVVAAAHIIPGVSYDSTTALLVTSLVLGILNAFVRPVLFILSIPFIVFTMGIFILILNALLFWLAGSLVGGFHVAGFWSAFFAALIVSLIGWILSSITRQSDGKFAVVRARRRD